MLRTLLPAAVLAALAGCQAAYDTTTPAAASFLPSAISGPDADWRLSYRPDGMPYIP